MQKILSVIVPAYNVEKYIESTLSSLTSDNTVLDKLDIVVVNDGSKDDTLSIAYAFSARYPDTVRVVNKENGGHGSTINAGIKVAQGKFFKVVDGDDWVVTENMAEYLDFLEKSEADMVCSPYYEYYEQTGEKRFISCRYIAFEALLFEEFCRDLDRIEMHKVAFRTEILRANNITLDENMFYVDVEYTCYPIPYVKFFEVFGKPVYIYRLGTPEQSMNIDNMVKRRDQHKAVLMHLAAFYERLDITEAKKIYLRNAISAMAEVQYMLYFSKQAPDNVKMELIQFDRELKRLSKDIYGSVRGKRIKLWRLLNFWSVYEGR